MTYISLIVSFSLTVSLSYETLLVVKQGRKNEMRYTTEHTDKNGEKFVVTYEEGIHPGFYRWQYGKVTGPFETAKQAADK